MMSVVNKDSSLSLQILALGSRLVLDYFPIY